MTTITIEDEIFTGLTNEDLLPKTEMEEIKQKESANIFGTEEVIFQQYMKEARRYPLLSADEEKSLGRRIALGDKKASDTMTTSNLRLVIPIARRHMNQGLSLTDLIQEGNLGLMKAVKKFEPDKGFRFSTYATTWIMSYIERALTNQGHAIRIPVHMSEKMRRYAKTYKTSQQNEIETSPYDTKKSTEEDSEMKELMHSLRLLRKISSLDQPLSDNEGSETLINMILDMRAHGPEQQIQHDNARKILEELLEGISERGCNIIRLRFGLGNVDYHTLREIGDIYNVTEESIRQIMIKAIEKIQLKAKRLNYSFEDLDVT